MKCPKCNQEIDVNVVEVFREQIEKLEDEGKIRWHR